MNEVVFQKLQEKDLIIKPYLIRTCKKENLSLNDFLLLVYFCNSDNPVFDVDAISKSLCLSEDEVMESFSKLNELNLVEVKMIKGKDGVRKESLCLDNLYKNITLDFLSYSKSKDEDDIYSQFESEFQRPLSRMEYEIISNYMNMNLSNELIIEALKLAVYNNNLNLRYISAILQDWKKKGYKTKNDLSDGYKKESNSELNQILDANWMDEN